MKILGIDPGLKATGYGLIEYTDSRVSLIETGTVEPKRTALLQDKIKHVYNALDGLISQYHPDHLVLEKLYAHYKHPATAMIMGHVRGAICLLCAQRNLKLIEFSVKRIRKSLTGNGNATKLQTQKFVAHTLRIDQEKLTLDASDALALALGCIQINKTHV